MLKRIFFWPPKRGPIVEESKQTLTDTFTVDGQLQLPPIGACLPPATKEITMHFSFDMAQQVCVKTRQL